MKTITLCAMLALALSSPAYAFGKTGHRVTGDIAERYLSADARAAVESILDDGESLAEATVWPDFMRASRDAFWREEAGPFHYVTVPSGKSYREVGAPAEGDAVTALARFTATLKDPSAGRNDKALALRFIAHIVGDLHQPLHAGNGEDRGGNDFALTFFGELTNLHAVWDSGMIDREQLSYSEMADWLAAKIDDEEAARWADTNPASWIAESTGIRDRIYPDERDVSWGYVYDHIGILNERLSMAGVRLAAYLNEVFSAETD